MNFLTSLIALLSVVLPVVRSGNGNTSCADLEKFEYAFRVVETLSDHDSKIETLEAQLEEIADRVFIQDGRISNMSYELNGANEKIEELNEKLAECNSHAHSESNPNRQKTFVGFTAYLSSNAWNLPTGKPIVLQDTLLNEGGGYSTVTGKFTAPVSGFYSFTVVIESKNYGSCVIRMVVDGVNTLDVVVEPYHTEQNLHGVNAGVISLTAGQEVWIEPYQANTPFLEGTDYYRFTTFSGVLLHRH